MFTGDNAVNARIAEAGASVSTGEYAVDARIVEALGSVSTGDNAVNARIVEVQACVSTVDNALHARIVEALASVSTADNAVDARIVKVPQNESWFPRSESEVCRRCTMIVRTPTRAPSAWTPLVGQPELRKMHSNSTSLRVQHQSQHHWALLRC